jgi:hypothetical protein
VATQAADRGEARVIPEIRNRDGIESGKKSQAAASIWGNRPQPVVGTNTRQNPSNMEVLTACWVKAKTSKEL